MNIKSFFKMLFAYSPPIEYDFSLSDNVNNFEEINNSRELQKEMKIFPALSVNIEYIKTRYNILINSDIVFREFTINARGKQYNSFIVYIDGMVDSQIMDQFILEPLMLRNRSNQFDGSQNKVIAEAITNNITVRKVKKFDLTDYLMGCLLPQNGLRKVTNFDKVIERNKCSEIALYLLIH